MTKRDLGKAVWNPLVSGLGTVGLTGILLEVVAGSLTNAFNVGQAGNLIIAALVGTATASYHAIRLATKRRPGAGSALTGHPRPREVTAGRDERGASSRGRGAAPGDQGKSRRPQRRPRYLARQLPARPTPLLGRGRELRALMRSTADGRLVVVDGGARVGTSALAVEAAHRYLDRHRDQPPDAALYLDLRPDGRSPLSATEAAAAVLAALDASDEAPGQPVLELGARLAQHRLLLVLDNVERAEQVAPLATPGRGLILVAGCGLGQLNGATPVPVGPLAPGDAVELLAAVAGRPDLTGDPAARSLVHSFGYQPAAIRLLASSIEPGERLDDLVPIVRRTAPSDDPAHDFWRSCWLVYDRLPPDGYRLLRLMATMPEVPVSRDSAPVLLHTGTADKLLGDLHARGLLDRDADWYRLPARLVPSVHRHPHWDRYAADTDRAARRLVRWYRDAARLNLRRFAGPEVGTATAWFTAQEPALYPLVTHWLPMGTRHRPALPAGAGRALAELAGALCAWYARAPAGRLAQWYRVALRIARLPATAQLPGVRSWAYTQLGGVARLADQPERATRWLVRAAFRRGPRHTNLALSALGDGTDEALFRSWQGLRLRRRRDVAGRASAMLALGAAYLVAATPAEAERWFWRAQVAFDSVGDARGSGYALNNRALILAETGTALLEAIRYWQDSHAKLEAAQDWPRLAHTLVNRAYSELTIAPDTHRDDAVACLLWATRVCLDHDMPDLALLLSSFVARIDPTVPPVAAGERDPS